MTALLEYIKGDRFIRVHQSLKVFLDLINIFLVAKCNKQLRIATPLMQLIVLVDIWLFYNYASKCLTIPKLFSQTWWLIIRKIDYASIIGASLFYHDDISAKEEDIEL